MAKATSCRAGGDECLAIVLHPAVQFAQAFAAKQVVLRRRRAMALLFEDDSSGGALRFLDDESMCRCAAVCTAWRRATSRDAVWVGMLQRDWSLSLSALDLRGRDCPPAKEVYRLMRTAMRSILRGEQVPGELFG